MTSITRKKNNKADKKRGKPKAVASPISTGGYGVSFENRAQAVRLLQMCLGFPATGIPEGWKIVELRFQARIHGKHTDDLVCTIENSSGLRRSVLMQMKSGLTARKSDSGFEDAIGAAWIDYNQEGSFTKKEDRIVIVYDAKSKHHMSGAEAIAKAASSSLNVEEWLQKIETPGASNTLKRNSLGAFRAIVAKFADGDVGDSELWQFLQHVSFLSHDLEDGETAEYSQWVSHIDICSAMVGIKTDAHLVWAKLVTACMELNAVSGAVDLNTIAQVIGEELASAFRIFRNNRMEGVALGHLGGDTTRQTRGLGVSNFIVQTSLTPTGGVNAENEGIPTARDSSSNKLISQQLDHINGRIKKFRYKDALEDLAQLGRDMRPLDEHQKARWYLMRATCKWHLELDDAASDFLKASELCDDDDKLAAARVRGLLMKEDYAAAEIASREALKRFPQSLTVWLIAKNTELLCGGSITENDIPSEHKDEADALQLVAASLHKDGNFAGAAKISRRAIDLPTAGFFTRNYALLYLIEHVTANSLNIAFDMLPPEDLEALGAIAQSFEPRSDKLWSVQYESKLCPTILHLGYVHIFLKRGRDALELLQEAKSRGIDAPEFIRLELEAHQANNDTKAAIERGSQLIEEMPADALVTFAQFVALDSQLTSSEQSKLLKKAITAASNLSEDQEKAIESISFIFLNNLSATGQKYEVLDELEKFDLDNSKSVHLLLFAAQLLFRHKQTELATNYLDKAIDLTTSNSPVTERYLVANTLFQARRYEESANIYEDLLSKGGHSNLHNELLTCYIRLGANAKAKKLVDSFPDGWMLDDDARHMAIELAQEAGDSDWLLKLSLAQLDKEPNKAVSWVLRLITTVRESQEALISTLKKMPNAIEGSPTHLAQIAKCEMENGFEIVQRQP